MSDGSPSTTAIDWTAFTARGAGPGDILLGAGVRHQLADRVHDLLPDRIALLCDATPIPCPEGDLKSWVGDQLTGLGAVVTPVVLAANTPADEAAVERATQGCRDADVVVTVGSGTISDLGKVAATGRPHVIVQTAASVNGYADDESVLLRKGVKRTAPSAYATVLVVDTDIVAMAPVELNRSGLGDMISMFTAPADWYLANQLGMDDHWSAEAALLARDRGQEMLAAARGIGESKPQDLELLQNLLTLSGISMGLARQTSPSSGMEHTVSHMLDMWAGAHDLPHQLHGAQVGVTTLWASLLWQRVVSRLDDGGLPEPRPLASADAERLVRSVFAVMDPSGHSGEECWSDYHRKLVRMQSAGFATRFADFVANWGVHREFLLGRCLADPAAIARALREACAPVRASDLDSGEREPTVWALSNSHLMRNRFNVCDLAFVTGLWNEDVAREVIAEADRLAEGLPA
ncbi:MAG: iron-containing alcohol dehydrogenase [Propionibacteriaceae bacterium]|nr:iron-containing alcohol dehydrogenase [Propionibacteriaceae bacterium]